MTSAERARATRERMVRLLSALDQRPTVVLADLYHTHEDTGCESFGPNVFSG